MARLSIIVGAVMATAVAAFAPVQQQAGSHVALHATANKASAAQLTTSKVDSTGNNLAVKNFLSSAESARLLSKVASSGLLSKASAAGITLSKVEPLIILAAEKGILDEVLILTEAAGPEVIPLLPTVVDLAPQALPLLAIALDIPPAALSLASLACFAGAAALVGTVPDDTVIEVAAQTLGAALLGTAGVAAGVGAGVLGKVKSL